MVKVALLFSCFVYKTSDIILQKWKTSLCSGTTLNSLPRREYRKTLISLRHHQVNAGTIGKIDHEFEANYVNFVQCRVMELLVFLNGKL